MKCSEVGDPYTKLSNIERDARCHPCGSSIPMTPAITSRAPLGWARFGSSWLGAMKESVRMENHNSKKCLRDSKPPSRLEPISRGLIVILVAVSLSACRSGSSGSEFIGKWVEVGNQAVTVEIKSTGNQYIVTLTDTTGLHRYVGQLNQTAIKLSGGIPGETISYMENTDSLDWRGDSYKRAE